MPSKAFEKMTEALVDVYVTGSLLKQLEPGYKFIKNEYDAAFYYNLSSEYYNIAAAYKRVVNACIAGAIAVCTFAIGGWIIGVLGRGSVFGFTGGVTATGETTAFVLGSGSVPVYSVPLGTKLGTSAILGASGIGMNAFLTGKLQTSSGSLKGMDVPKLGLLMAGGVAKVGPLFGLLFGTLGGALERSRQERLRNEILDSSCAAMTKQLLNRKVRAIGSDVASGGRYTKIGFLTVTEIDDLIRKKLMKEIGTATNQIVKENTGYFSSPDRGKVYSKVHGKLGVTTWAPILTDVSRARTRLMMMHDKAVKQLKAATWEWINEAESGASGGAGRPR